MKIGKKGLEVIKHFEGFRAKPYLCPAGVLTIGYGTTSNVKKGQVVNEAQALEFLIRDATAFEKVITDNVKVPLNQDQFDGLVAFVYNVGPTSFLKSTLLKVLNQGHYDKAAAQFLVWNKAKVDGKMVSLEGLTRRRTSESTLFATGQLKF